jgi:hypothetical protein
MSATAATAVHAMDVIHRCVNTLHDLAAESPCTAAETLAALNNIDTPAANRIAHLVRLVAEARHGKIALERAERR